MTVNPPPPSPPSDERPSAAFESEVRARLSALAEHAPAPSAAAPDFSAEVSTEVMGASSHAWRWLAAAAVLVLVGVGGLFLALRDDEAGITEADGDNNGQAETGLADVPDDLPDNTPDNLPDNEDSNDGDDSNEGQAEAASTPAAPSEPVRDPFPGEADGLDRDLPAPLPTPVPFSGVEIPDGTIAIVPEGPYVEGQMVTLLLDEDREVDLWNAGPSFCATVIDPAAPDAAPVETCDPRYSQADRLLNPPPGTQGLTVELSRRHFGAAGYTDCADPLVSCRLLLRDYNGNLQATAQLTYIGDLAEPNATLTATPGDEPGTFVLDGDGLAVTPELADYFTSLEQVGIINSTGPEDLFVPERVELTWRVGGVCGFGDAQPPDGAEALAVWPEWWPAKPGVADPWAETASLFATCDWWAHVPAELADPNEPVTVSIAREIYGYRGWLDCAEAQCFVSIDLQWQYPVSNGGSIGSDSREVLALLNVPAGWAREPRPSLSIAEPGPYEAGSAITVELRNYRGDPSFSIAWCQDTAPCGYGPTSSAEDGVITATITLPANAERCGLDRCYVAVDSRGEGLPPPAILVVPVVPADG